MIPNRIIPGIMLQFMWTFLCGFLIAGAMKSPILCGICIAVGFGAVIAWMYDL